MARKIVVVLPGEADLVLSEVLAHDEEQLQQHLTEYPEMIPVEEFGWSGPMMVVGRESSLPSGAPDLVGVGPEGEILIAEFKTGPQNPDFRARWPRRSTTAPISGACPSTSSRRRWPCGTSTASTARPTRLLTVPTSLEAAAEATWADSWDEESQSQFRERVEARCATGSSTSPWSPSDSPRPWRARRSISTRPESAQACTSSS